MKGTVLFKITVTNNRVNRVLKPRVDVTRSPKQGISGPWKGQCLPMFSDFLSICPWGVPIPCTGIVRGEDSLSLQERTNQEGLDRKDILERMTHSLPPTNCLPSLTEGIGMRSHVSESPWRRFNRFWHLRQLQRILIGVLTQASMRIFFLLLWTIQRNE